MVLDPGTQMLIATAIATAAKGASDYMGSQSQKKSAKRRAKAIKEETQADLLQDALHRSVELESHRLGSRQKLGKRKVQNFQDTSDLVRGALNI